MFASFLESLKLFEGLLLLKFIWFCRVVNFDLLGH